MMAKRDMVPADKSEIEKLLEVAPDEYNRTDIDTVKAQLMPKGSSDSELALYLGAARHMKLSPWAEQILSIRFENGTPAKPYVTYRGLIAIARRSGLMEGWAGPPQFTADGKTWTEVWLSDKPPAVCKVGVYRKGDREPSWGIARWDTWAQYTFKNGKKVLRDIWEKKPDHMLMKQARRIALISAFPMLFGEDGAPTPAGAAAEDLPLTAAQLTALHTVAGLLKFDQDTRHREASEFLKRRISSFKEILRMEAVELLEFWQDKLPDSTLVEVKDEIEEAFADAEVVGEVVEDGEASAAAEEGSLSEEQEDREVKPSEVAAEPSAEAPAQASLDVPSDNPCGTSGPGGKVCGFDKGHTGMHSFQKRCGARDSNNQQCVMVEGHWSEHSADPKHEHSVIDG
jgi:hypothetical protein